jgi:hypothetical protein
MSEYSLRADERVAKMKRVAKALETSQEHYWLCCLRLTYAVEEVRKSALRLHGGL